MLNRSASLAMTTSVLEALPGKLDIKRHSPRILFVHNLVAVTITITLSDRQGTLNIYLNIFFLNFIVMYYFTGIQLSGC